MGEVREKHRPLLQRESEWADSRHHQEAFHLGKLFPGAGIRAIFGSIGELVPHW